MDENDLLSRALGRLPPVDQKRKAPYATQAQGLLAEQPRAASPYSFDASQFQAPDQSSAYQAAQQFTPYGSSVAYQPVQGLNTPQFDRDGNDLSRPVNDLTWAADPGYLASLGYTGQKTQNTTTSRDANGGDYNIASSIHPELQSWLDQNGLTAKASIGEQGGQSALFNGAGQQAGKGVTYDTDPGGDGFGLAALAAAGLLTGGLAAAGEFGGAAGAFGEGLAGGGGGLEAAGLEGGAGLAGGGGATNAALIDSALMTPGYGASSAGLGGGAGSLAGAGGYDAMSAYLTNGASDASTVGGMGGYAGAVGAGAAPEVLTAATPGFGSTGIDLATTGSDAHLYQPQAGGTGVQDLANMGGAGTPTVPTVNLGGGGSMLSSIGDWITKNPGTALQLGGLLGSSLGGLAGGGGSSGGSGGGYTPKPVASPGWQSSVTPQYGQQAQKQPAGLLANPQGQVNDGLWRYNKTGLLG